MNRLSLHLVAVALIVVSGCGSSRSTSKKTTKEETPATKAPEPAPAVHPVRSTPPPVSALTAPAGKNQQAAPATTIKATDAKPADAKPALKAEGASDFTQAFMKGKKIDEWILALDSKNKDEVIEAINVCQLAKSKKAVDKLNELSKSTDKEIAEDAKFAVSRINAGH